MDVFQADAIRRASSSLALGTNRKRDGRSSFYLDFFTAYLFNSRSSVLSRSNRNPTRRSTDSNKNERGDTVNEGTLMWVGYYVKKMSRVIIDVERGKESYDVNVDSAPVLYDRSTRNITTPANLVPPTSSRIRF